MNKLIIIICLTFFSFFGHTFAQSIDWSDSKNHIFFQANNHLEKRGSDNYHSSNPDFALSYERIVFSIGKNNFLAGARTGLYREYVLTGQNWDHPINTRFFIGFTPSYRIDFTKRMKIQVNMLWDVLLPDDYNETWSYFAIEPAFLFFFTEHFYGGVSATMGVFHFFDPKAYMDKAGIKIGFAF